MKINIITYILFNSIQLVLNLHWFFFWTAPIAIIKSVFLYNVQLWPHIGANVHWIRGQGSLYFGQLDFCKRLSELAQTHLWFNGPPYCNRIRSNQHTCWLFDTIIRRGPHPQMVLSSRIVKSYLVQPLLLTRMIKYIFDTIFRSGPCL